jgi:aryl-alcohol dehydrogenase-like predicted oxidoreductase
MEYRVLGRTGIEVSALCFGTMTFGREADEATSAALYRRAREAGINFFDCANVYAGGESERILGRLVDEERDRIVLTSKVCMSVGEGLNQRGLSRRHIMQAVEDSLRRLGTDRLDVYFAHHVDARTPLEQTLRAFDDLVRQGKVLHAAVSNWEAWRTAKALGLAERHGWAPIAVLQPMYNLVKRQAEVEILPLAAAEGLGVITYSPLGGGLLTGKYRGGTKPDEGRLTRQANYATRYGMPAYHEVAERFVAHADERGVDPVSLAVAWVMHHPAVTAPIIGARHLEQLEPALAAADVALTDEWRRELSAMSIEPPPATDRLEEQVSP